MMFLLCRKIFDSSQYFNLPLERLAQEQNDFEERK
jgi:hypothetical protein